SSRRRRGDPRRACGSVASWWGCSGGMADDGWSGRASCGTRNRQRRRPIGDPPGRELQRERRPFPDLALDREVAAEEPRQVAADGEPEAEPRRLIRRATGVLGKDLLDFLRRDARP